MESPKPTEDDIPKEFPKETFVKKGDSLYLKIFMDVTEPHDVIWEKDGVMISDGVDSNVETGFDGLCNYLKIKRADSEDSGTYEVFGEKGDDEVAHRTNVIVDGNRKPPPSVVPKKKRSVAGSETSSLSRSNSVKSPPPTPPKKPTKSPAKTPPATPQKPGRHSSVDFSVTDTGKSTATQKPKKTPPKTPPKSFKSPKANKNAAETGHEILSRSTSIDSTISTDSVGRVSKNLKQVAERISEQDKTSADDIPFAIERKLKPVVVEEGDAAILSVTLSKPAEDFKWFINNNEVEESVDHIVSSQDNLYTLTLSACAIKDDNNSVKFTASSSDEELSGSIKLKVQPAVPGLKAKSETKEQYVVGDDIIFDVLIKGHQEPYNIVWYNGFKRIKHMQGLMEITKEGNHTMLAVKSVTLEDGGVYKVSVKSFKGSSDLKFPPIKIKEKREQITFEKKKPVTRDSSTKTAPKLPSQLSRESSVASTTESEVSEEIVAVETVSETEASPLESLAAPVVETTITDNEDVPEEPKPTKKLSKELGKPLQEEVVEDNGTPFAIEEKLKPAVVEEGDEAVLSVTLSKETEQFQWFLDNNEITDSDKHIVESNKNKYTLKFKRTNIQDDKKSLKFVATHSNKELTGSIRMKVLAAVPGLKQVTKPNQEYFIGDDVQFEALIKGHREPYKVEWSKGFKKINPAKSEATVDSNVATLLLKDITVTDAGSYKCTVKSSKGQSELKFSSFKVKGL